MGLRYDPGGSGVTKRSSLPVYSNHSNRTEAWEQRDCSLPAPANRQAPVRRSEVGPLGVVASRPFISPLGVPERNAVNILVVLQRVLRRFDARRPKRAMGKGLLATTPNEDQLTPPHRSLPIRGRRQTAIRCSHASGPVEWFGIHRRDERFCHTAATRIVSQSHSSRALSRSEHLPVGQDYYLVNSSFAYFSRHPDFHSRESRALDPTRPRARPSVPAKARWLGGSHGGSFAPAISSHDGLFYVINTLVDAAGNFFVTAKDPAGPWSDPVWLPEIDGIDPSFFFDGDGRAIFVKQRPATRRQTALRKATARSGSSIRSRDVGNSTGPRTVVVNGGVDIAKHPCGSRDRISSERTAGIYLYLRRGAGPRRVDSEVVFRSQSVTGPFSPWTRNPILTQRTLDPPAPRPGHVHRTCRLCDDARRGMVGGGFLACRPYERKLF